MLICYFHYAKPNLANFTQNLTLILALILTLTLISTQNLILTLLCVWHVTEFVECSFHLKGRLKIKYDWSYFCFRKTTKHVIWPEMFELLLIMVCWCLLQALNKDYKWSNSFARILSLHRTETMHLYYSSLLLHFSILA